MRKLYALVVVLSIALSSFAQSTANYSFTTATNGSLALDMNGNTVDMSTGTTLIFGASQDNPTSLLFSLPTGFTFYFMGTGYTQFSTSGNGVVRLGSTLLSSTTYGVAQASQALISPFGRDLATSTTGKIHYKVVGTAPNRTLVIEWVGMRLDWNSSTADGTYQLRLYETTGVIEFVYGAMKVGTGGTATNFSIGISSSNTDNTYATVNTSSGTVTRTGGATTNSYTAGAVIADLNSSADGSRRVYRFTPAVPAAPSALTFSSVSISGMTLNWTDNATNELGYQILRSTDNINFTQVGQVGANITTYNATGLGGGTTYYWRVVAFSEGASSAPLSGSQATLSGTLSGVKTVGAGGDYNNLTTAFAAINTNGLNGNITLQLIAGYPAAPETYPIASSNNIVGNFTVSIYPTVSGLSITSANTTGTLNLNGAMNITIDGRVNAAGTTRDLVIANTSTGYAVQFVNEAVGNTISYAKVQGSATSATSGVIVFGSTTGVFGNSNNIISDCQVFEATTTPTNGIYSSGSATVPNANNTVRNSLIYNFFNAGSSSNGILLSTGSSAWTISNNSFYQTATRTTTAGGTHGAINISNASNGGFTITGNSIGGNTVGASGTAWTIAGAFSNKLIGISITAAASPTSSVQGNTIANISLTSTNSSTTAGGVFSGIYVGAGSVDIGTTTANTVGSGTGTGSITTITSSTSGGAIYGIYSASSNNVNISNNVIGSFNLTNATSSAIYNFFYAIRATSGVNTISGNLIGSSTTALSINNSTGNTSTTLHATRGISSESGTSSSVLNNSIYNIAYTAAGTGAQVQGINITSGTNTVSGNLVRAISSNGANSGTGTGVAIMGIYYGSSTAPAVVSQNTIYDLSVTAATAAVTVRAMYYGGPTTGTNIVEKNFIHSLSTTSTSTTASIEGLYLASGIANVQNNMIRLGIDKAGVSLTNAAYIGMDKQSSGNMNIYHNSVYIGGTGVTVNANSIAFRRTTNATDDVRDNIFANVRLNAAGTGKHYAIGINGTTTLTSNYNILYTSGTGTFTGYSGAPGATDYAGLSAWTAGTGLDANSISLDPMFVAPTGNSATVNLHVQMGTPAEAAGVVIAAVTDDFDGQTRASLSPADIGADAGDFTIPGLNVGLVNLSTPIATGCYTATEAVKVTLKNYGNSTIDFSVDPVTINVAATGAGTYSSNIVLSSGTLAAGATLVVTLPATFDMTAQGVYTFTGSATVASDINTANDAFSPTIRTSLVLGGTKTVGVGGDYTTLTQAVGVYNSATCFNGQVVFRLLDATYPNETFPITINQNSFAGNFTLTIQPATGVNATISGSSATSIIKLNGADNIIIDGSNNGTNTRNLTIQNNSTASGSAAVWVASLGTAAGAQNNVIRNLAVKAGTNTVASYGIYVGGTSIGTGGNDNENIVIDNNAVSKAYYGIAVQSLTAAGATDNPVITNNQVGSNTAADYIASIGIQLAYVQAATVSNNTVFNIITGNSLDPVGILISTSVLGSTFNANNIYSVGYTGTGGYGGRGFEINTGATASALTLTNNMIAKMFGDGWSSLTSDAILGIRLTSGGGVTIDHNTVHLSGSFAGNASGSVSAALYLANVTGLRIRDNIFSNTLDNTNLTSDKAYAIYSAASANTGFLAIDYNDYYVGTTTGVLGYLTSDLTTIAAVRTGFGSNVNSVNVQPYFVSATDAHIDPSTGFALDNLGTPVGVSDDIDYDPRDPSTPDMGADEFTSPLCSGAVGGTATAAATSFCNSGSTAITAVDYSIGAISTYQWESSLNGTTWTAIAGQTNPASFATGTLNATTQFRLKVTCNTGAATDYSNVVTVTINPLPTLTVSATQDALCAGTSTTITVAGNATTYAWTPATGLSATTGTTVTATPSLTTTYTVTGTIAATGCTASATQLITVNPVPDSVTITPSSATVCSEGTPALLTAGGGRFPAQATLGTGTATTATAGITPFNSNWEGSRTQYLVRASELTALGFTAGDLTQLGFKVTASGSGAFAQKNFMIKIAHTAQAAMASAYGTPSTPFVTVYTSASEPAPAVGNKVFTFSQPFTWDGVSNILIDICHDNDPTATCASCFSGSSTVQASTTPFNSVWGSYADNAQSCGVQAASTITTFTTRPNMIIAGPSAPQFIWSPVAGLYTDAAGTTAYTGAGSATVYARPAANTTYTATATTPAGCSKATSIDVVSVAAPVIASQPDSATICRGNAVTFSVTATNALSYQWRKDGVDIAGATSSTYSIASVSAADAGIYTVAVIGNSPCGAVISNNAILRVPGQFLSGFTSSSPVCAGSPVAFTNTSAVTGGGSVATSSWSFGDGNTSTDINPLHTYATAGTYTVTLSNLSNNGCASDTITQVVTVNPRVLVTSTMPDQAICPGGSATFSVSASGTGLSYEWRKDNSTISGANGSSYTISNATAADAGVYRAVVQGTCGTDSIQATLTINTPVSIGTQPVSQTVCAGVNVTFSVAASGTALTYQWLKNGSPIATATASTYTVSNVTAADAGNYTVQVTGACGTLLSNAATLTLNQATAIGTQPASAAICTGQPATFTVNATGTGTLTYQWKKDGIDIAGATAASYTIASVSAADAASYSVVVTGTCGSITSSPAVLTVNTLTAISTQPVALSVCPATPATFSVTATGSGTLTYQWRKDGNPIAGATSATFTIASATAADAGNYSVVVTGACGSNTSNNALLTVTAATSITTQPLATQTVCAGSAASFAVVAAGSGTVTYQWRKDGNNIAGATSASFSIPAATAADAGTYTVVVTASCGTPVTSANAVLTVNPVTVITTQPVATQAACPGTSASFSVAATGTALSYQWRKDGNTIAGATSATFTINPVSAGDAGTYTVVVTGTCGVLTSSNAVLTINNPVSITSQPAATQTVCAGTTANFTVAAAGTGATYQWRKDGNNIAGATSASYSIAAPTAADAGTYTVVVTGTCGAVTSTNAVLTVNPVTAIGTQPQAQAVCPGASATFTVAATGTGTLSYQWRKDGNPIAGATSATFTIPAVAASDAGSYAVVVSGSCGSATSAAAVLSLNAAPSITTQPAAIAVCPATAATFTVAANGTGLSYQWRKNGTDIAGATAASFTIPAASVADTGAYSVVITGACGAITSNAVSLAVNNCGPVTVLNGSITAASVQPTAAVNDATIVIQSSRPMQIKWQLVDAKGAVIRIFRQNVVAGQNRYHLDLSILAAGGYFLNGFTEETGKLVVLRFAKL